MLARPLAGQQQAAARIEFKEPLFHLTTASYDHMHTILNHVTTTYLGILYIFTCLIIYLLNLAGGDYNLIILYGDEQFVSRALSIQKQHQAFYGNILPFPGIYL